MRLSEKNFAKCSKYRGAPASPPVAGCCFDCSSQQRAASFRYATLAASIFDGPASVSEAVTRFSLRLRSGHALLTFFFPKESKGSLTIEYLGSVMFRREWFGMKPKKGQCDDFEFTLPVDHGQGI